MSKTASAEVVVHDDARAVEHVNPLTGELLVISDLPNDALAEMRDQIREARDTINGWARIIDSELTRRLDADATRSGTAGRYKFAVSAPKVWSTDEKGGRAAMLKLVEAGKLTRKAVDAAFEIEETIKARRRGLNALHAHADATVRDTIAQYDQQVDNPTRRVTVTALESVAE